MKNMNLDIKLNTGIDRLEFDMPLEKVISLWGEASEVETIEEDIEEATTILHYEENGCSLIFEGYLPKLAYIDVYNENMTLFNEELIDKSEEEIIAFMKSHNYTEYDCEDEDWGEKVICFPQGNIDFFYEEGELVSATFYK